MEKALGSSLESSEGGRMGRKPSKDGAAQEKSRPSLGLWNANSTAEWVCPTLRQRNRALVLRHESVIDYRLPRGAWGGHITPKVAPGSSCDHPRAALQGKSQEWMLTSSPCHPWRRWALCAPKESPWKWASTLSTLNISS